MMISSNTSRPHLNSASYKHRPVSQDECQCRHGRCHSDSLSYPHCSSQSNSSNENCCKLATNNCCCDEFDLDFAAGTTCHGIYFICNSSWSWYRRLCWLLLVTLSLGLLATQLHDRWVSFLKFELKTEVAIESARSLMLPTVTLCNANFFSRLSFTELDRNLLENVTYTISGDIENDINELERAGAKLPDNWTETYWQAANEYELLEQTILEKHNVSVADFSVEKWLLRAGWQLTPPKASRLPSPIIQCRVGKLPCSAEDFKPVLTPQGLCYSLNSPPKYVQKAPGGLAGINIFLDINQEDYSKYNLEGQSQFECGVKVILHEWYERPDVGQSVGIPPGMSGFVAVKGSKRMTDDEPPWSNCLLSEDPNKPYSERQCINECAARQTLSDCSCRLWYEPGNATICGVAKTTACLLFKELVGDDSSDEELRCKAECLEACSVTSYSASVSYTSLASNTTSHELTQELVESTHDPRYTEEYVRANVIALQIAFAQLVIDRTSSTPALTVSAFLSDVGGQLGLFAGISLITVIELLEYPIAKLVAVLTGNRTAESLRTKRKRRHHYSNSCNNLNSNANNVNSANSANNLDEHCGSCGRNCGGSGGSNVVTAAPVAANNSTTSGNNNVNSNSNNVGLLNRSRTDYPSEFLHLDSFDKTV